ncbi:MAG: hypothetical protein IJE93_05940 [Clostridia bacterium]|nr:hypothetical protein [Clostridia bacterium]
MKDWSTIINKLIDKFDIKIIGISCFITLGLMLIPKINILKDLMPLDTNEKIIYFIFSIISNYLIITILILIFNYTKKRLIRKPKKLLKMIFTYGSVLNEYYSEDINAYSKEPLHLESFVSKNIINELTANKILEKDFCINNPNYYLREPARQKLTKYKKAFLFIDKYIASKHSKDKEQY